MHTLCMWNVWATLHETSIGCGLIVFYGGNVSWPFAERWAAHMENRDWHLAVCGEVAHPHGETSGRRPSHLF